MLGSWEHEYGETVDGVEREFTSDWLRDLHLLKLSLRDDVCLRKMLERGRLSLLENSTERFLSSCTNGLCASSGDVKEDKLLGMNLMPPEWLLDFRNGFLNCLFPDSRLTLLSDELRPLFKSRELLALSSGIFLKGISSVLTTFFTNVLLLPMLRKKFDG